MEAHLPALRADLFRVYHGLTIETASQIMTLRYFVDLVMELPRGSQVWKATGGPMAWTDETEMLSAVELGVRHLAWQKTEDGQNGKNVPEPIDPPGMEKVKQDAEEAYIARKARAFLERQRKKAQQEEA